MIDTTDSKEKKQETEKGAEEPKPVPVLMQEPESEIQSLLYMTDELNSHAVKVFEKDDEEQEEVKDSDLERNFVDATAIPKKQAALHQLYKEEISNLENLQCRSTFFNMLAFGYKSYESVGADIQMTNESFAQLQGLVFNELCENQSQSAKN